MYRVGIDIGGTFTDMLLVGADGTAVIGKTLTTPDDPSLAVENALRPRWRTARSKPGARHLDPWHDAGDQRADRAQGRAAALLTTSGFRDAVEIAASIVTNCTI